MTFPKLLSFHFFSDFSSTGNKHFKIPGLLKVFHDCTNTGNTIIINNNKLMAHNYFTADKPVKSYFIQSCKFLFITVFAH